MKRSRNEKAAIILAVSVILSVTACSVKGTAYIDGNQSETGFSSSAATTSGTIYEESTLPATVSVTTTAKETTTVLATVASTPATTAEPKWKETKKSAEMYLNTSVYSRTKAYLGAPTADLYMINDKVKVVAVTDTDYYKLENGRFIHCDYLSDNKVIIQTTTTTTAVATPAPQSSSATKPTKADPPISTLKPLPNGYFSSGYEPLDKIIFPILDDIISDGMNDNQKLRTIYDYLTANFKYQERTIIIPKKMKAYSQQLYAINLFEKGYGICYDFSGAFLYMTRAVGLDTKMVYGTHESPRGYIPHSWVTMEVNGIPYIFDPGIEVDFIQQGYTHGHLRYYVTYEICGGAYKP